jgi:hypothetical protein
MIDLVKNRCLKKWNTGFVSDHGQRKQMKKYIKVFLSTIALTAWSNLNAGQQNKVSLTRRLPNNRFESGAFAAMKAQAEK